MNEGGTAVLSPQLYKAITTVVDDRTKDIRVTREDFNELRAIVAELASAQTRTEERMGRLEDAVERLAQAQAKTEERMGRLEDAVERLAQAQAKTEERMGRLEDAVERLAQAQARTEERIEELAEAQRRTEGSLKELATQVGKLSDNIGFGLEDVAKVVLPGYLERHLHIYVYDLERKFFIVDGEEVEINLYGIGKRDGKEITILGEAKSRIYEREVNKFIRDISKVLPVIKGEVLKVMFGYLVHPSAVKIAETEDITLVASYQR